MPTFAARKIEDQFARLPAEEQLELLERLIGQFRIGKPGHRGLAAPFSEASVAWLAMKQELDRLTLRNEAGSADLLNEAR